MVSTLFQRSLTEWVVSEYDLETSTLKQSRVW